MNDAGTWLLGDGDNDQEAYTGLNGVPNLPSNFSTEKKRLRAIPMYVHF